MSAFDPTSYNNSGQAPQGNSGGGGAPGGFEGFFVEEPKPYSGPARVSGVSPVTSPKGPKIRIDFDLADGTKETAWIPMSRKGQPNDHHPVSLSIGAENLAKIYGACGFTLQNGVPCNPQGKPDFTGIIGARLNVEFKLYNGRRDFAKASAA